MVARAVLLALLLAGPAQAATGPVPAETSTRGGTLTDGDRYAVWVRDGVIRVLDEETRTVSAVAPPEGCNAPDPQNGPRGPDSVGDGQLAFTCAMTKEFRLFDLESRTWRTVPSTERNRGLYSADSVHAGSVGRHWIVVSYDTGYHGNVYWVGVNRATGEVNADEPSDLGVHMDADSPELWTPLCRPLRRYRDPDWDEYTSYGSPFVAPYVVGQDAIVFPRGKDHLVLRRCGRRARTTITRARHWQGARLASGYVTWLVQDPNAALAGERRGRARIHLYSIASRRRRSWTVPGAINANTDVAHTRNRIIVDKPGSRYRVSRYEILLEPGDP